jgi:hypothetical protein
MLLFCYLVVEVIISKSNDGPFLGLFLARTPVKSSLQCNVDKLITLFLTGLDFDFELMW